MLVFIFIGGILLGAFITTILLSILIVGKKKDSPYCTCPACKEKIYFMDEEIIDQA
jgi:prepilin signal peptidase PulO-like enzyme (type II secretory pathway)